MDARENYYGASGWAMLDENGDRTIGEKGNFDFWQITDVPARAHFTRCEYVVELYVVELSEL